jgi:hypothetical protein
MADVKQTVSFGESFKKFNILPLANDFLLSLLSFTADNMEKYQIQIYAIYARDINVTCICWTLTLLHPRKDCTLQHWFPKWALPPPGGQWDYLEGCWRWAPLSALFANLRLTRLEPRAKYLPHFVFKVLLLLLLSKLFPLVTFVCIYDSELSQVTR